MATNSSSKMTVRWRKGLDEALAETKTSGKPILLDFFNPS